ncbi:hypothetical protein CEUSTIGMA_g12454.t1 [Chlamydomonas eustigma]|uniref:Myosin motor domain-containing protein n=1 Tax=Chlamydomonas eustigma TaxID=1157962 RepID=A0A250XPM2_9CHLO|nr:hypothetical protein CEUSTIGMA_g12454.t1 [Chlamydomonas eustigma]|eukprot:GAX85034.1 hypothetical protein CEUSTIGMA_g12454.t1 [Chlamydomonas eustigma]
MTTKGSAVSPLPGTSLPSVNHDDLVKGGKVWVRVDDQSWQAAELRSLPDGSGTVSVLFESSGRVLNVDAMMVAPSNPKLQEGIPDLTHLSYLNEPGILYNLQYRYGGDQIYTLAGPVLIALNPCKNLPLYTRDMANTYKVAAVDTVHGLEPHIYLVAANAFRNMLREKTSQSLIVNGESGAGKTETTKKAMQYFAILAGGTGVEDQVLETNPVLEAFGNAKTLRNHNSSRFGKLIQIHFNQSNRICGARIKTYLLEKSRVVHQLQGERSYHIFYQLVKGATEEERQALRLPTDPSAFRYLAGSGCTSIEGVDDAADFRAVRTAMLDVGITRPAQSALFTTLSGIMWLGNVEFAPHTDNDSTIVENTEALENACQLLGLDKVRLCMALTQKRIITPTEIVTKLLKEEEARESRDALAKAVYAALFNWVVEQINAKLDTGKRSNGHCISILDIYGFEQFVKNSFEQLCINYANERLQQQFTRHLFTLEQQEYESEGIDWTKIEFTDNQDCVDVIEMQPPKGLGVLAVLDDQCKFPKATDEAFGHKLKETLSSHSHFSVTPRAQGDFIVMHYAGPVQYSTSGFLDKNKDTLSADLIEVMGSSSHTLLPVLGAMVRDDLDNKRGGGQTVGYRFGVQLRDLISELDATGLHFVRCIKPNAALKPNSFDAHMTLHQLRCCGVLEVARIARAGFPTRYTHGQFAERYAILLPKEEQEALLAGGGEGAKKACAQLLDKFQLGPEHYQMGHTKIFFRAGVLGFVEDRWARMQSSALKIQATFRMHRLRASFLGLRAAALQIQAGWKARVDRMAYEEDKRRRAAAVTLQRLWRGARDRNRFMKMITAASLIQMAYRRYCFRRGVRKREYQRKMQERAMRIEQESFVALRRHFGVEMEQVRSALEIWSVCREKGINNGMELIDALESSTVTAPGAAAAGGATGATAAAAGGVAAAAAGHEADNSASVSAVSEQQQRVLGEEDAASRLEAPLEAASAAAAPAGVAASVRGALAVAAAGQQLSSTGSGFERLQALQVELERSKLEKGKLVKELQAQKMLKDRDNLKAAEAQGKMLAMIRGLQEYVSLVKGEYSRHHLQLPPLPPPLAMPVTGPGSLSSSSSAAGLSSALVKNGNAVAGSGVGNKVLAAAASGSGTAAVMDASRYMMHVGDDDEQDQTEIMSQAVIGPREGSSSHISSAAGPATNGTAAAAAAVGQMKLGTTAVGAVQTPRDAMVPAPGSRIPTSPSAAAAAAAVNGRGDGGPAAAAVNGRGGGPAAAAAGPQRSASDTTPSGTQNSGSQRYVNQLREELERVSQVLVDDVDFIAEVKQGVVEAPDMDPAYELNKLKKKFELWKKEFKEKLGTTESVLKKLDRLGPSPSASKPVTAAHLVHSNNGPTTSSLSQQQQYYGGGPAAAAAGSGMKPVRVTARAISGGGGAMGASFGSGGGSASGSPRISGASGGSPHGGRLPAGTSPGRQRAGNGGEKGPRPFILGMFKP